MDLPHHDGLPAIRTDFSNDEIWQQTIDFSWEPVPQEDGEIFPANLGWCPNPEQDGQSIE